MSPSDLEAVLKELKKAAIPRVALRVPGEAAAAMGVSEDFVEDHIRRELPLIYRGRYTFVLTKDLERWGEQNRTMAGRE